MDASSDNYQRANYLYQAAQTAAVKGSPLAHYYGYLAKEVMKKIVGKMHPDLKRTVCSSCNNPLNSTTAGKIIPAKCKKRKKNKTKKSDYVKGSGRQISRTTARNKQPNRVRWDCNKCYYRRSLLQRPSHTGPTLTTGQE